MTKKYVVDSDILDESVLEESTCIKGLIAGRSNAGKTSLLLTLPSETTCFVNLEGGDLSIKNDWKGKTVNLKTWQQIRDFTVLLRGPDRSKRNDQYYSQNHYDAVIKNHDPKEFENYKTIFIDSITVAARWCFAWASGQPDAFSEKTGKPDVRGAYGLHAREMIAWLIQMQYIHNKDIWMVCLMDQKLDDLNRVSFELQLEGQKTSLELPGIIDEFIVLADLPDKNGVLHKLFVCDSNNPWGYFAKDRSGCLELYEKAHLGELSEKIRTGNRVKKLIYNDPLKIEFI